MYNSGRKVSIVKKETIVMEEGACLLNPPATVIDIEYSTVTEEPDRGTSTAFFDKNSRLDIRKKELIREARELLNLHYPAEHYLTNDSIREFRANCIVKLDRAEATSTQENVVNQIENFVEVLRSFGNREATSPSM